MTPSSLHAAHLAFTPTRITDTTPGAVWVFSHLDEAQHAAVVARRESRRGTSVRVMHRQINVAGATLTVHCVVIGGVKPVKPVKPG